MRLLICLLLLFGAFGCGGSNEPVIPEQPTSGPPAGGPSKEGLPAPGGIPEAE